MQTEVSDTLRIPVKLYRIGELITHTPFSRQTIHNYTIMGLIREAQWTQGGHRLYDVSVFERLSKIMQLKRTKTLSEIRRILSREDASAQARPAGTMDSPAGEKAGGYSESVKN
jgi:DNA-binding transcriptional MerR regulator